MKLKFIYLLVLPWGCSTDLPIVNEHPAVPVIYAQIDPYDTVNYVRVEKTFKINRKEDWGMLNRDSLMYKKVEVCLHGKKGEIITWTEQFKETEAIKDTGFFPPGEYQAFKLDHKLPITIIGGNDRQPGIPDIDSLVLEVRIPEINLVAKAIIKALSPVIILNYKSRYLIYVYPPKPSLFATTYAGEIPASDLEIAYCQIDFTVHFKEYYHDSLVTSQIHWLDNKGWNDEVQYVMDPDKMFNPMMELIPENNSVLYRTLDSIDKMSGRGCSLIGRV